MKYRILRDIMVLQDAVNLQDYDYCIIAFSGGKDSLSCILHLLDLGFPREKIELWHHLIDGENPKTPFMDWPVTRSYVQAISQALKIPVYYSWRDQGYRGEILRKDELPHNIIFQTPEGLRTYEIARAQPNTRRKFPMLHATDLNKRWCSSVLKIDVARIALSHQDRFLDHKILFVTGERAEESTARAGYEVFEIHKMDNRNGVRRKRTIDAWRPVHGWTSKQVWDIIDRWKINPHPCYRLGWGRCSCAGCIFSSASQTATLKQICPQIYGQILGYEKEFDFPIHFEKKKGVYRKIFLDEFCAGSNAFPDLDKADILAINSHEFNEPIFLSEWKSPRGRWGDPAGPQ